MIRHSAPDDEPVFNVNADPCGSVANPHIVSSPTTLVCKTCGPLAPGMLERLQAALANETTER